MVSAPVLEGAAGATACGYTGSIPGTPSDPGGSWVGVEAGCEDDDNPPPFPVENNNKMYIYDTTFSLPACFTNPSLSGSMLADNAAAAYLNNNLLGYQSTVNGGTVANPSNPATPFGATNSAFFLPGTNTLDFLVEDHSQGGTALDFRATISFQPVACPGTLKICKVAGAGVAVGTPFSFDVTTKSPPSITVKVAAGPAPGGNCVVVGTFAPGAYTTTEEVPAGDNVTSITGVPTGTANLGAGTFSGTITSGQVSEVTYTDQSAGTLKICKVAGYGVAVGTLFTFNATTGSGSSTVTVPAGPAPGGYCKVVGTVAAGAYTTTEVIPAGDGVTSISGVPAGTPNLGAGTFSGTIAAGLVTEVTYTDQRVRGVTTGYLEICKQTLSPFVVTSSDYVYFGFNGNVTPPGDAGAVPADACSPAIQVPAGPLTVSELAPSKNGNEYFLQTCSTIPAVSLVACNPGGGGTGYATVTINPGNVSTETILNLCDVTDTLPKLTCP